MNKTIRATILVLIIFASLITPCLAKEYLNPRFKFAISIHPDWEKFKNPAPANGDGISFTFPGKGTFSASGMYNVLGRSLKEEATALVGDEKILKQNKITIDGMNAIMTLSEKENHRTLSVSIFRKVKGQDGIYYTIFYQAPKKIFEKYQSQAEDSIVTFRKLKLK